MFDLSLPNWCMYMAQFNALQYHLCTCIIVIINPVQCNSANTYYILVLVPVGNTILLYWWLVTNTSQ